MKITLVTLHLFGMLSCVTLQKAEAEEVWTEPYPGIRYLKETTDEPKKIHAIFVDLTRPQISFRASRPEERGLVPTKYATLIDAAVVVNGDFFDPTFKPIGLAVGDGEVWPKTFDTKKRSFLACDAQNRCEIDTTASARTPKPEWRNVVGGREILLSPHFQWSAENDARCKDFCTTPHPRTAVGLTADKKTLILVVVEGRQTTVSGVSLSRLASIMKSFGAETALNLDGGGSSQLVIDKKLVTGRPSNETMERALANSIGIKFEKTPVTVH